MRPRDICIVFLGAILHSLRCPYAYNGLPLTSDVYPTYIYIYIYIYIYVAHLVIGMVARHLLSTEKLSSSARSTTKRIGGE